MTDITDPTDFGPPTLSSSIPKELSQPLNSIDALLRCRVCKDLFTTPMITSCSHTFCSLCIRRCLSAEGRCPVCRAQDQEMKLRRNWVAEEMVEGWRVGRSGVLDGLKALATNAHVGEDVGGVRRKKRRKVDHDADRVREIFSGRTTRSRSKRGNIGSQEATEPSMSQSTELVVEDSEEGSVYGDDVSQAPPPETLRQEQGPADGLVPCPGCGQRMKEDAVFPHLDRCPGLSGESLPQPPSMGLPKLRPAFPSNIPTTASSRIVPAPTLEERLPTINYNLLNDKLLRKKLRELGIPDWGPKPLLQKRHTEWVNLWNANCDSRHPRTKRDLLHELDTWERTQGGSTVGLNSSSIAFGGTNVVNVGEKDFDKEEWSKSHQDDFKDLIKRAREKRNAVASGGQQQQQQEKPLQSAATASLPNVEVAQNEPGDGVKVGHDIPIRPDLAYDEADGQFQPQDGPSRLTESTPAPSSQHGRLHA